MTFRVKIYGAGSIGNHLAHASRRIGWDVMMCDVDPSALRRTKNEIYPTRYGKWDNGIALYDNKEMPADQADLVIVGTPPHTHLPIALDAVEKGPRAILIEKPVCGPDLKGARELVERAQANGVALFVGYDHVVSKVTQRAGQLMRDKRLGGLVTLDVEFREYWGGIFKAHPWLAGPWESYLGFSEKGGGASGEHSHGVNLWQHIAHEAGAGRVIEVQAMLDFVKDERVKYDSICLMHLKTETGLVGRCVQDVVTEPSKKWARAQCGAGYIEWHMTPQLDTLTAQIGIDSPVIEKMPKTRPDDFITELRHIEAALASDPSQSPISLSRGLDTMLVLAASHLSHRTGRTVSIDYSAGPTPDALNLL